MREKKAHLWLLDRFYAADMTIHVVYGPLTELRTPHASIGDLAKLPAEMVH